MIVSTSVGAGRPLVILPGFGLDSAVTTLAFEPVFASGAGDCRRVYLDLPGTGGSPPVAPNSDAVLDAVAHAVSALLGAAPFLLAGHSYGGYLAAGLARRLPGQVEGLLLVCSGIRIDPGGRDLSGVQPSTPEPGWLEELPADLHQHLAQAVGNQSVAVGNRLARAFRRRAPVHEAYLESLRASGYRLSDEDSVRQHPGPVAMLTGRRDRIAGYRDQLAALVRYPHGSYVALADAGHYLPFEQPDRFAALTLDWLARCPPSP